MTERHLCLVHGNVDSSSAIGLACAWNARQALESGWRVTLIARRVAPDLRSETEVIRYSTPPRFHLAQWAAARYSVRRALAGRTFDVVHVHEPQLAALADVWQVHFLSTSALVAGAGKPPTGLKQRVQRLEQHGVRALEDRCCRALPPQLATVFDSDYMRAEFEQAYGALQRGSVIEYAAPPATSVAPKVRSSSKLTLGYLGGADDRKGWKELLSAVADVPEVDLLLAGTGSEHLTIASHLRGRVQSVGRISDLDDFFRQIDVLVVPSRFDPFAFVVLEAAARGVPSIVSPHVGAGQLVQRYGAGVVWDLQQPLGPIVAELRKNLPKLALGSRSLRDALDERNVWERWVKLYRTVANQS